MPLNFPFKEVNRRVAWLRGILLAASFSGMIACAPLWLNARDFPLIPIFAGFPILPAPLDKVFFGGMLLTLVLAFWYYRPAVKVFLLLSLFAYGEDQNRGQPWFYMYCVLLGLTLLPEIVSLAAARWAISAIYLWSGVQKCNARFFEIEPAYFTSAAANWHLPGFVISLIHGAVAATPFLEMGIGLFLWSKRFRLGAIIAVVLIHGGAVLLLGPLGYNYNWVVLPWNLAMIGLVCALFLPAKRGGETKKSSVDTQDIRAGEAMSALSSSRLAASVVLVFALLPALSFMGMWDSYFSFSLYSENAATANIFVTQEFGERLPPKLRTEVKPFPAYDPQFQGPFIFTYAVWCYQELHVPPIPEPRAFRAIFQSLRMYAREPADLRMIVGQRAGPVIFYEGDRRQYLTPKR